MCILEVFNNQPMTKESMIQASKEPVLNDVYMYMPLHVLPQADLLLYYNKGWKETIVIFNRKWRKLKFKNMIHYIHAYVAISKKSDIEICIK